MALARFWREISGRYNMIGSTCGNCNKAFFPPRDICPECHRASIGKMKPSTLEGKAKVISHSIIHDALPNFEMLAPYILVVVEFDNGVRATSQLVNCAHDQVSIGMEVEPTFRKIGEEGPGGVIHYGYKFKPVK